MTIWFEISNLSKSRQRKLLGSHQGTVYFVSSEKFKNQFSKLNKENAYVPNCMQQEIKYLCIAIGITCDLRNMVIRGNDPSKFTNINFVQM